ncbi:MAG: hypothetical protein CMP08_05795 [Xanthomonadales bacterium]|nr:hypothetical protein [Xanthomonadales bacterium]
MNDVMKKRLIGVVIIIAIGVLVPVLLSQCVGSNNEADKSGDMRVYTVDPDGQTQSGAEGGEKSTANDTPDMPEAVSPQRDDSADADQASEEESFETPPVVGSQEAAPSEAEASTAEPDEATPASASQRTPEPEPEPSPEPEPEPEPERASSGSDYGASTQGRASQGDTGSSNPSSGSSVGQRDSISGWVVQVGSFSKQSNAADLARSLGNDFSASYTPVTIDGRTLYHVNIGPFSNEAQARDAAQTLSQQGRNGLVRNLP